MAGIARQEHAAVPVCGAQEAAGLGTLSPFWANAQSDFPSRPIRVVVGLPAGGAADVVIRALGQEMEKTLKQPVVIDNRPGGLYVPAVQAVASAPADGHTLLYINSSFVTVQVTQNRFDLLRQFMPLTKTGEAPSVIAVTASSPFKTLTDLVEYARKNPDALTYGTLGVGTVEHLRGVQFTEAAGIKARAIPYKGGPDMVNAVIAGSIAYTGINALTAGQLIAAGKIRALAATDTVRIASLPDVPTVGEAGVKMQTSRTWSGFVAHADTPAPIANRLFNELVRAMNSPQIKQTFAPMGVITSTSASPEEFRRLIASEAQWMGAAAKKLDLVNQ